MKKEKYKEKEKITYYPQITAIFIYLYFYALGLHIETIHMVIF